jgi:hypothetical protein
LHYGTTLQVTLFTPMKEKVMIVPLCLVLQEYDRSRAVKNCW